jgi:hypothetical protein
MMSDCETIDPIAVHEAGGAEMGRAEDLRNSEEKRLT